MQAELRALLTVEHSPIDALKPEGDAFSFWLRALVGPAGASGEESFDFLVCSPASERVNDFDPTFWLI